MPTHSLVPVTGERLLVPHKDRHTDAHTHAHTQPPPTQHTPDTYVCVKMGMLSAVQGQVMSRTTLLHRVGESNDSPSCGPAIKWESATSLLAWACALMCASVHMHLDMQVCASVRGCGLGQ